MDTTQDTPHMVRAHNLDVRVWPWNLDRRVTPEDAVPLPGVPGVLVDPTPVLASKGHYTAPNEASLSAYVNGKRVASIAWGQSCYWDDITEPSHMFVERGYRRRGIATALWREAQRHDPTLEHSEVRTDDGDAWAKSTGDTLPDDRFSCEQDRHEHFAAQDN